MVYDRDPIFIRTERFTKLEEMYTLHEFNLKQKEGK